MNGSFMRTVPLVLAYLCTDDGKEERPTSAARAVSELTHHGAEAADTRALGCVAIRYAVL